MQITHMWFEDGLKWTYQSSTGQLYPLVHDIDLNAVIGSHKKIGICSPKKLWIYVLAGIIKKRSKMINLMDNKTQEENV